MAEAADRIESLERDLAARDKAHECDAQIAADLIAGEQAKRYEVEAERDKLKAALVEAETDAAKWRALISCGHLRMMGWAGFDKDGKPAKESLHFGMEAWSHPHINLDADTKNICAAQREQALTVLNNFVAALAQATQETSNATQEEKKNG
jgi:hypothetical protein